MKPNNQDQSKIAIIGFSDMASPLEPLWPTTHRALLPIAGKPLIVHLVELLADAGIRHVRIAGSIQQFAVRHRLRSGREWGLTIRYSDLHGADLRAECLAAKGQCLYLIGDHLIDADLTTIVDSPKPIAGNSTRPQFEAGIWRLRGGEIVGQSLEEASGKTVYVNELAHVTDFHNANMRAIRGLLPRLNLPGSAFHRSAICDWKSHVAADACIGQNTFIGKHCRVHSLARLDGDCALSNGVVVGRGARLRNVSVLPNCQIGSSLSVKDAVIGSSGFVRLNGTFCAVTTEQLSQSRDAQECVTGLPGLLPPDTHYPKIAG